MILTPNISTYQPLLGGTGMQLSSLKMERARGFLLARRLATYLEPLPGAILFLKSSYS